MDSQDPRSPGAMYQETNQYCLMCIYKLYRASPILDILYKQGNWGLGGEPVSATAEVRVQPKSCLTIEEGAVNWLLAGKLSTKSHLLFLWSLLYLMTSSFWHHLVSTAWWPVDHHPHSSHCGKTKNNSWYCRSPLGSEITPGWKLASPTRHI